MDPNVLSFKVRATIADSLADAQENFDNAAAATDGEAAEYFRGRVSEFETVYDLFIQGRQLSAQDVALIFEALDASIQNCDELGLEEAQEGYEAAKDTLEVLL